MSVVRVLSCKWQAAVASRRKPWSACACGPLRREALRELADEVGAVSAPRGIW